MDLSSFHTSLIDSTIRLSFLSRLKLSAVFLSSVVNQSIFFLIYITLTRRQAILCLARFI